MGTLVLVRHGRTPANADGILAGRTPGVQLDEIGRESVLALRKRMAELPIKKVVASPLERTRETAQLLFPEQITELHDGLIECEYGDWTGRKLSELKDEALFKEVLHRPQTVTFPNGESMQAMHDRAVAAVRELDEKFSAEHSDDVLWAAVSHGDVIKAIIADSLGLELQKFQKIHVEPASVSVIRYNNGDASLIKVNDSGDSWIKSLKNASNTSNEPTIGGQTGATQ